MLQKIRDSFEKFQVHTWDWFNIFFLALLAWFLTSLVIGSILLQDNETNTGNIGDTIGGITAPFIGLLNAILVYMAFQQQIRANQEQRQAILDEQKRFNDQNDYEILLRLFERCELGAKKLKLEHSGFRSNIEISGHWHLRTALFNVLKNELRKNFELLTQEWQDALSEKDDAGGDAITTGDVVSMAQAYTDNSRVFSKRTIRGYLNPYDRWFLEAYMDILKKICYWAKRLDKSTMNEDDKSYLVQSYMNELFKENFHFADRKTGTWLYMLISSDDKDFIKIQRMEMIIEKIFNEYPLKIDEIKE